MLYQQQLNERITLVFILILSAILRFSAIIFLEIEPESDAASYMEMAKTMLNTGHMDDLQGNIAFYSSGYPLFLIPFFAIFGSHPEVVQVVNSVLGIMSVLLVYLCSKMILPNWKLAMIPAFLWATYPPAILYMEYVAKENLMVILLLLQVFLMLHFPNSSHKFSLSVILGIIFGISMLVGPAVILTGALIILVTSGLKTTKLAFHDVHWKRILAFLFGCIVILTPWLSYTNNKLGTPVLNTNGSFNLYLGNNPNSSVNFVGIQDTPMGDQWHALREQKGQVEAFAVLKEEAIDYILDNPGKTAWLSLKKIAYFWFPPIHEGKYGNQSTLESMMRLVWLIYYVTIIAAVLLALCFYKRFNYNHYIVISTVILYCVIHAAAYVIFRYRVPAMPFMCMLAVCGINFFYLWWNTRKQRSDAVGDGITMKEQS